MVGPSQRTPFGPADVLDTWRALLAPRRVVPILSVGVPLVLVQRESAVSPWAWAYIASVMVVLVWVAPVAYRGLLGEAGAPRTLPLRFVAYVALGALAPLAVYTVPRLIGLPAFTSTRTTTFISAGLFWVAGYGLGRDIDLERRWLRESRRAQALAEQAERAQLMALRAQLDPHFLFNTLNAIAEWCREDPAVAERALLDLSALLRRVLVGVRAPSWPLADELDVVRRLFALHNLRDPGRFSVEWNGPIEDCGDDPIAPMLLLPLAENAMTHGPGRGHRGVVKVSIERLDAQRRRVTLTNPGAFRGRRDGGEGLATVEGRLRLAYGSEGRLDIAGVGDRTQARVEWVTREG